MFGHSKGRIFFLAFCAGVAGRVQAAPPSQTITADVSQAGDSDVRESNRLVTHQSESAISLSFLERRAFGPGPWYYSGGLVADSYLFQNQRAFPIHQLQDAAGKFSVEYFLGSELAAHLTVYPGFYFEDRLSRSSFDVPFIFITGVPITEKWSGVIGVSNGRFLHHPLPIVGFNWVASPKVHLEAVYPEPALVVDVKKNLEARLAGQLLGAGFKTDSNSTISRVSYFSYRIGAALKYTRANGTAITGGGGYEVGRTFDAYRDSHRWTTDGAPYVQLGVEF